MKNLLASLHTEIIKTKNSLALWLVVLGAAFVPFFFLLVHIYDWDDYIPKPGINPWNDFLRKSYNGVHFTFLPLFIVLLLALLFNIEHKSNTWKHIFTLPVSRSNIFISKYLVVIALMVIFYCLLFIFLLADGLLLSLWKSDFNFLKYPPVYGYITEPSNIGNFLIKSFVSSLALIAIHFWLSFRIKNLVANIGIGLVGAVIAVSIYIPHWKSIIYFPYAFPVLMCNFTPDTTHYFSNFQVNSFIYFSIILLLSYIDFIKNFRG